MNIIIPMAGMGKRMRPHTLTTPKPLLPIAGKSIVHRLVMNIAKTTDEPINEIAFVIGEHFGEKVEKQLIEIAARQGAKGKICYQTEALGTAHAVYCAKDQLDGKVVVAFADTLFKANFTMDTQQDGIIWVQKVKDPRPFGVVKLDEEGYITGFVEKPETFVLDRAIIGIYFFGNGKMLADELKYLLDNNIRDKGEYQLTSALENMKQKGCRFKPGAVDEWLDCGNKNATVFTNQRVLEHVKEEEKLRGNNVTLENSRVIEPCLLSDGVHLKNTTVGPHVSIGNNTSITGSVIKNSIIQDNCDIKNANFENSMLGKNVIYHGKSNQLSLSDFSTVKDN